MAYLKSQDLTPLDVSNKKWGGLNIIGCSWRTGTVNQWGGCNKWKKFSETAGTVYSNRVEK